MAGTTDLSGDTDAGGIQRSVSMESTFTIGTMTVFALYIAQFGSLGELFQHHVFPITQGPAGGTLPVFGFHGFVKSTVINRWIVAHRVALRTSLTPVTGGGIQVFGEDFRIFLFFSLF